MRNSAKKNKGKPKSKNPAIIDELIKKHNTMVEQIAEIQKTQQQIAKFAATEFGKMLAAQEAFRLRVNESIGHLDNNVLATAEMVKEVFGQLSQVDLLLGKLGTKTEVGLTLTDEETAHVKTQAEEWYTSVMSASFAAVRERLLKEAEEHAAAAQKAKEEAEKAEADKSEVERVEQELQRASTDDRIPQFSGGEGADIPEGADVFGG